MYSQKNYFELGLKVKNHKSIYRGFEISEIRKQLLIYNNGYDLVEKIMVNTKLNKEFGTEVCNLLHRRMLETICKENILNQNKDEDSKRS